MTYLYLNGLINGAIPAGNECPFLKQCTMKHDDCPSKDNLKDKSYPCHAARAQSLITISDSLHLRKLYVKE